MVYLNKGYIGCFEMTDKTSGREQLERYAAELINAGYKRIVAPIDGDTWHTYRLVSWSDGTPFFPLEPRNPIWVNEVYLSAGFKPLKKYRSDVFAIDCIAQQTGTAQIRGFRKEDLACLHKLSVKGFRDNFLYSDISFNEFSALYAPILPLADGALAVIAEVDDIPAGFVFSFIHQNVLILKTIAVLPEYRRMGIGSQMVESVLSAAKDKGFNTAVAALIADDNASHNLISRYESRKIREYTLYSLEV